MGPRALPRTWESNGWVELLRGRPPFTPRQHNLHTLPRMPEIVSKGTKWQQSTLSPAPAAAACGWHEAAVCVLHCQLQQLLPLTRQPVNSSGSSSSSI